MNNAISVDYSSKMERRVVWPPQVIYQTLLGILRDDTGNYTPRDIGRSSQFSNVNIVIRFGDTLEHDNNSSYMGVKDNTCAIIPDPNNSTLSKYIPRTENNKIPIFIKQYPNEFAIPTKFWSFSRIVETGWDDKGIIHGYTWFKITRMYGDMQENYLCMGVAKVEYDPATKGINAVRSVPRTNNFGGRRASENVPYPSFGSICALRVENHIYLYGQTSSARKRHSPRTSPNLPRPVP